MFIVEWFNESSGYDQCIVHSWETARMISRALTALSPKLTVRVLQIGNGCSGTELPVH